MKIVKILKKNWINVIIIISCLTSLITYKVLDNEKKLERYWIRKSRPIYDIINYTKIIIRMSLFFNIKLILLEILDGLSII